MVIVSGTITLRPGKREGFLRASMEAIEAARATAGCRSFVVAADPIEPQVANVYEEWASEEALLKFRGAGPTADMRDMIASANVQRHKVSSSGPA
ncbi:putative quinol monooxygenase [Phenylobacterium sp.]|jgi:quinol monooxygenase YgiN|uniref:putative quinol monooxygenase n=1 Tax=Phenylobacterium sp. TaxID=1871053 RepID=UPI0039C97DD8